MDLSQIESQLSEQTKSPEQLKKIEQDRSKAEEQKNQILHAILTAEALERLNRIGLVNPEKKAQIEMALLQQAHSTRNKIDEDQLVTMIDTFYSSKPEVKITFKRRNDAWDDDEDDI
ncbi:putative programmed cell death protein 5 [Monocercomonoides exilis]|uniref:putative programmed cell death protein 5 n=1 Tax=Monocercomonoides exilis TaxID=2049356 RepID=UPI00355A6122|nr:putative programmed cell death protein 5 [Monocercomonoides exilis]|eukprot:MONOS_12270.1-p1 / transcript=MONOS_12270.1 / gene=MONOS_12270 / organism=Monocercomonoides_exilis_PA203 / gene_product=unspecified product / transcript_product=unspecified product / location=Mono_scaffold00668:27107-27552(+) / protein_length=116 / sequence_SO=supercontig / SO=protein_coding / is_pseudo=false